MKTAAIWMIIVLALSVVFSGCSGATVYKGTSAEIDALEPEQTTPDGDAEETVAAQYLLPAYDDAVPSLWETYADAFRVGAAVNTDQLTENSAIYQTITKHYNVFVAENEMKPLYLNPSEGTFYFDAADRFVEFGERVDAALRGHTLVWHSQTPAWWFEGEDGAPATSEQLLERMETYITEVVSRYKGRIQSWDVVNEVISDSGTGLRGEDESSQYAAIIGDLDGDGNNSDYIEQAFLFAHAADPDAQLIINEHSIEGNAAKLDALYELIQSLLEKGIPVDGVGIQAHIQIGYPTVASFERAIEKLAGLKAYNPDFSVLVTELDVSIFDWSDQSTKKEITPALQTELAERYASLFEMFRRQAEKGNLDAVVMWGVYDGRSWLDTYPVAGRTNAPLLFDRALLTKPAFWGVIDRSYIPEAVAAWEISQSY